MATKVFLISHSDCNPAGDFGAFDEKKLLSSAKSGKGLAFDDLCKNHRKKILQTTYRITRNREDAEDALQDSLLRAFLHIQEFDGRSSFATWLTRIAINSSLMILRKKRATRQVWVENPAEVFGKVRNEQTDHRSVNPELLYARGEEGEILRGAIRDLRPSIRQVLELQQLQENSIKDTAKFWASPQVRPRLVCSMQGLPFERPFGKGWLVETEPICPVLAFKKMQVNTGWTALRKLPEGIFCKKSQGKKGRVPRIIWHDLQSCLPSGLPGPCGRYGEEPNCLPHELTREP